MTAVIGLVDGSEIRAPWLTQEQIDTLLSEVREARCWMKVPITEEGRLEDHIVSEHVVRVQVLADPPVRPAPVNVEERKRQAALMYK